MVQPEKVLRDTGNGIGSSPSTTDSLPVTNQTDRRNQAGHKKSSPHTSPLVADDRHISVLMVDDHPLNRTLLKRQLGLLGLHVEEAAGGVEALSRWQSCHFDLIITDCNMPEMDGYELTRHIRKLERQAGSKRTPIIAWTANVRAEEEIHCLNAGMDDMLTKSAELHEFRAMLLVWLVKTGVLAAPME